jgi:hypothetical protein
MARPKKDAPIDLGITHVLSEGLIERLTCPDGLRKAFLRDREVAGLRVRVTANGAKAFVYEAKLRGKAISWTIGPVGVVTIKDAQGEALRLAGHVNRGEDPRNIKKAQAAERVAQLAQATAQATTVGDLWPTYLAEGKPKRRDEWKPRYLLDPCSPCWPCPWWTSTKTPSRPGTTRRRRPASTRPPEP